MLRSLPKNLLGVLWLVCFFVPSVFAVQNPAIGLKQRDTALEVWMVVVLEVAAPGQPEQSELSVVAQVRIREVLRTGSEQWAAATQCIRYITHNPQFSALPLGPIGPALNN